MSNIARLIRKTTKASTALLIFLVGSVGAVAFIAELQKTWLWYFRMEEFVALATPVITGLVGLTFLLFIGTVVVAPESESDKKEKS